MKQFIKTICVLTLLAGLAFSANKRILKSEFKQDRMKRMEPDYRRGPGATRDACPHQYSNNPNSELTVIDSSTNGFGMVSTVTRPIDVNSDGNMLVVYRQYAGENTTHGQLGAGYGVVTDGAVQWDVQYNVNYNGNPPWGGGGVGYTTDSPTSQARYPSGIASEEFPYAVWNEYTAGPPAPFWEASCSADYGGRPYFSYDEFGWGGESWLYPAELDPLWDCSKDLWAGSVGYGYNSTADEHHVTAVYDDWTRTGSYQFTSEAVEDGYIVLGTETLIVNPQHLGTDGYSSAAILSMNDNGQGLLGIDGIFAGNDMDAGTCGPPASNLTCNKTPMFKLTNDYGSSWQGNHGAFDFYFVPDEVFNDIFDNFPAEDIDACTGEVSEINDFWSWYEFDMRVDQEGNPHIVISIIGESTNYFHFLDGYTGFYHLTIDRDNVAAPGAINSATGWNWSYVPLPANNSFMWNRPDGYSYLYGAMCQISLSRDNPDIVYMVANIATEGDLDPALDTDEDGVFPTPGNETECALNDGLINPYEQFPNWSEDIYVAKSSDNGSTWTALENLTQTPLDPTYDAGAGFAADCSPEEQYVHTAHWSDDLRVYFQYNQPNWAFNEIGDPLGADCMNRVFLGYAWVEETGVGGCQDEDNCSYDEGAGFHDEGECGQGLYDCSDGTSGCGCDNVCGDTLEAPAVLDCQGNCDGGAIVLCNYVVDGGGDYCANPGTDVCTESTANNCEENPDDVTCTDACNEESEINNWTDCSDVHCGTDDPLFYPGDSTNDVSECGEAGYVACDGGRCYTCDGYDNADTYSDCILAGGSSINWGVETVDDCDDTEGDCADVVTDEASCGGLWITFANAITDEDDPAYPSNEIGDSDECYCNTSDAEIECEVRCVVGDCNDDGGWNVLDIVVLANCVLSQNCGDGPEPGDGACSCAGDLNGDGGWNVLDIVQLANCVLAGNCGGRVDDASESTIIKKDNKISIVANGFIGGVQMTLTHGSDFTIEMTDRALFADYLTTGNETRLLIISPETEQLFSYNGEFEITEIIVANSQYEVSVDMPMAASFRLSDAYPNPFNPVTTMTLAMPVSGEVTVEVYNVLGQVVATLASGYMEASTIPYTLTWDASNASSGVYFVQADAAGFTKTQKLMLVK